MVEQTRVTLPRVSIRHSSTPPKSECQSVVPRCLRVLSNTRSGGSKSFEGPHRPQSRRVRSERGVYSPGVFHRTGPNVWNPSVLCGPIS